MESNTGRENAVTLGLLNWWETGTPQTSKPLAARIVGTTDDYVTNLRSAYWPGNYTRVFVDGDRINFNFWGKPGGGTSDFPYGVAVEPWS